ncbi:hypothetical protein O6H91_19G047400 [Diphasiastrum complanatum]|uniref:Uncharacterized protein n=1 Tax=Diphasiastrum complanatum TaxID=34168 RepID=A0ACC2AUZ8_DIPCM|nr:hypothetical protein O6H91_19G047400 [Diphasiastrum complanatum]
MATAVALASTIALPTCRLPLAQVSKCPSSTPSVRTVMWLKSTLSSLPGSSSKASARKTGSLLCNTSRVWLPIQATVKDVDVSKVVPQADRVLVRLEELPEKSEGGILLPKAAVKFERYLVGEVISAGKEAGAIEKGQKVMFSDLNAYEVDLGTTEKLCFCKAGDLLAIVA